MGSLHFTIIVFCVILIYRAEKVSKCARFMRHFYFSYIITGSYYLMSLARPILQGYFANQALSSPRDSSTAVYTSSTLSETLKLLQESDKVWYATDSLLSIFSSYFLLSAWHLLQRYPKKESIDWRFDSNLKFWFTALVAPILVALWTGTATRVIFIFIDTLIAAIAMILFGLELRKRMAPKISRQVRHWKTKILLMSGFFIVWGVLQPGYIFLYDKPLSNPYFGALLVLKFLCAISLTIVSAMCMDEKPGYES